MRCFIEIYEKIYGAIRPSQFDLLLNKELSLLQDRENPDWQSEELGIGMEVTEALERKDGRKRFVINQYLKKGLFDQNVKKEFEEKYPVLY